MTAVLPVPTLLSDADLRKAIAWGRVPLDDRDERLEPWCLAGDIWPGDDGVWHLTTRRPPTLTVEQRAYIADDVAAVRREDV